MFNDDHLGEVHDLLDRRALSAPVSAAPVFGPTTLTRFATQKLLNSASDLPARAVLDTLGFGPTPFSQRRECWSAVTSASG